MSMANHQPQVKKPIHVPKLKGPPKQYQKDGHWIVKPGKTQVLTCTCGNKYIKTRAGQSVCIRCLFKKR
jgi:hypothetical protein